LAECIAACPPRPPWTNHPPTVRACGWPLQGSWLDHCSPATAYGLTRCACRTAFFVGAGAGQSKPKALLLTGPSRSLRLSSGPTSQAAWHGPAPSGPSPKESGADRQRHVGQPAAGRRARARGSLHARSSCLSMTARKAATRSGLQLQPLHIATHNTPPRAAADARAGLR